MHLYLLEATRSYGKSLFPNQAQASAMRWVATPLVKLMMHMPPPL